MFGISYRAYDPIGAKSAISVSSSDKPIDVQRKRLTHDLDFPALMINGHVGQSAFGYFKFF